MPKIFLETPCKPSVCLPGRSILWTSIGMQTRRIWLSAFYDALILSTALKAKCDVLHSEDMQHGLLVEERLQVINPLRRRWRDNLPSLHKRA